MAPVLRRPPPFLLLSLFPPHNLLRRLHVVIRIGKSGVMPTYADEMAARIPRNANHNGPVRLWISSGEMVRGPNGQLVMTERWEEEEIMDTDAIDLLESIEDDGVGKSKVSLAMTIRQNFKDAAPKGKIPSGGSLLVLDTNTLLSSLPVCMAIFTQCLARNVHSLSTGTFLASPIMLIVPYVVVRELDGLKGSTRKDARHSSLTIGQRAQRANRWMLEAVQRQKKRTFSLIGESIAAQVRTVPEHAWVVHVENSAFYRASRNDALYNEQTPDDEIISHSRALQRDTHQTVWLCSDDVNMKLRAESDSIVTFSMADWAREEFGHDAASLDERDEKLSKSVFELIDQWSGQMNVEPASPEMSNGHVTMDFVAMDQDNTGTSNPTAIQGVKDSAYAFNNSTTTSASTYSRHATTSSTYPPVAKDSPQKRNRTPYTQTHSHAYPSDRSSASSMWANRH